IARGAGCPNVSLVNSVYDFMAAAADAFEADQMATIVAKVEAVGPDHYGMDLALPENTFRFKRYIQEQQRTKQTV
ncbi:MAG: thiamine pyrophosphate-dependent enzyme, partial [Anaerolineales bacterium]